MAQHKGGGGGGKTREAFWKKKASRCAPISSFTFMICPPFSFSIFPKNLAGGTLIR